MTTMATWPEVLVVAMIASAIMVLVITYIQENGDKDETNTRN